MYHLAGLVMASRTTVRCNTSELSAPDTTVRVDDHPKPDHRRLDLRAALMTASICVSVNPFVLTTRQ